MYVVSFLSRLPIGISKKNLNAQGLATFRNAFADIKWIPIMIVTLGRNSIHLASSACAKNLCSSQQGLKNVECIGL